MLILRMLSGKRECYKIFEEVCFSKTFAESTAFLYNIPVLNLILETQFWMK